LTALAFDLPRALEAHEPPEARGLARDEVRLMVARRGDGRIDHARFRDLPDYLEPGDVLVVNTSATLPAAIPARRADGTPLELHVNTAAPHLPGEDWWVVELRGAGGATPFRDGRAGDRLTLAGDAQLELVVPYAGGSRLWLARVETAEPLPAHLARHGHPIRYGYVDHAWPLDAYQTAFARFSSSAALGIPAINGAFFIPDASTSQLGRMMPSYLPSPMASCSCLVCAAKSLAASDTVSFAPRLAAAASAAACIGAS